MHFEFKKIKNVEALKFETLKKVVGNSTMLKFVFDQILPEKLYSRFMYISNINFLHNRQDRFVDFDGPVSKLPISPLYIKKERKKKKR